MIAILTTNPILARMLTLEAARAEVPVTAPDEARVWLLDLDRPPRPLPQGRNAYVIGFTAEEASPAGADFVLSLPYPSASLQRILKSYFAPQSNLALRHLPGVALVGERRVHLSPAEEKLFALLLENRGQTVPTDTLLAALPTHEARTNVLQVHMYRLRRKLSVGGGSPVRSVRGIGYRLAESF